MSIPVEKAIADAVEQALYTSDFSDVFVEEDARSEPSVFRVVVVANGVPFHMPILPGEGPVA